MIRCCCCSCRSRSSKHFQRKVRGTVITVDDWQYSSKAGRKPGRAARSSRSKRLEILRSDRSDWRCFLRVLKTRGRLGTDIHHCHTTLVCFGLPVQGHAKKAKSTQKHGPPQAPGAAGGAHLSTPCDPGHPTVSGSTHRVVSNRDHSFPKWIHSPSDVGTKKEPIHFTQDDHHSRDVEHGHSPPHKVFTTITEGETITRCPHWFPDSCTYRRRTTKERSGRTKSPFQ